MWITRPRTSAKVCTGVYLHGRETRPLGDVGGEHDPVVRSPRSGPLGHPANGPFPRPTLASNVPGADTGRMRETTPCPECRQPLDGGPACPHCGLPLTGPTATRLWLLDQRLTALDWEQQALRTERVLLLGALRSGPAPALAGSPTDAGTMSPAIDTVPAFSEHTGSVGQTADATAAPGMVIGAGTRTEVSNRGVQNTLLTLGGLLLAGAALVFGAVTYQHLGATGRAVVLLALTGCAAAAPVALVRRGLTATAETFTCVALVLSLLDAGALRSAGLGEGLEATTYTAAALSLLAAATAGYATRVPVRTARVAAVLLAQPVVPLLLARSDAGPVLSALALAGLAAVNIGVWLAPQLPREARLAAVVSSAPVLAGALLACVVAVRQGHASAAFGLLAVAAVTALTALGTSTRRRNILTGTTVVLVCFAALAAVAPTFAEVDQPLVLAAAALLLATAAHQVHGTARPGALAGAVLVSAGAVLAHSEQLLLALTGPLTWLAHPWALGSSVDPRPVTGTGARAAVSTEVASTAAPALLLVLLAAMATVLVAGQLMHRVRGAAPPAAGLGLLALVVSPVAAGSTYPVALSILVVVTAALVTASVMPSGARPLNQRDATGPRMTDRTIAGRYRGADAALLAALVPGLMAAAWAVADRDATLAVLPCLAVLAAAAAARPLLARRGAGPGESPGAGTATGIATSVAVLLAGAELAAAGFAGDLTAHQVGSLLVVGPTVAVGVSFLLRDARRRGAEIGAVVLAGVAMVLAVNDVDALSWVLAASGLLTLAVSVRPDRRLVGIVGGLLLSSSSWVRLADAGVQAPEPYVLPLAGAALLTGYLRRRTHGTGSLQAYGPGLTLALLPILARSIVDDGPTRGLLLLLACAVVVMLGARFRLRAPLLIGGAVLVVETLYLVAPYAAALPRWVVIATTGAVLLTVGATYERRRRDVGRLRAELATWS